MTEHYADFLQQKSEAHTPTVNGQRVLTCSCGSDEVWAFDSGRDAIKIECMVCGKVFFNGSYQGATEYILDQIKHSRGRSCLS